MNKYLIHFRGHSLNVESAHARVRIDFTRPESAYSNSRCYYLLGATQDIIKRFNNVKDQLLAPERLEDILCKLVERRTSRQTEVAERRCALEAQRDKAKDKLARLYRAIEDGVVELDADLKDRIQAIN